MPHSVPRYSSLPVFCLKSLEGAGSGKAAHQGRRIQEADARQNKKHKRRRFWPLSGVSAVFNRWGVLYIEKFGENLPFERYACFGRQRVQVEEQHTFTA